MINEKLRAKSIERIKEKIRELKSLSAFELILILDYIEELEAQRSAQRKVEDEKNKIVV